MKKLLLLFCLLASLFTQGAENIWADSGFEKTGNSNEAYSGNLSLNFTMQSPVYFRHCTERKLEIEPFAVYRATAYVKGTVSKGEGYAMYVYGWDSFGWCYQHFIRITPDYKDWKKAEITFSISDSIVSFTPLVLSNAENSSIFIDDLRIEKIKSGQDNMAALLKKDAPSPEEQKLITRYLLKNNRIEEARKYLNSNNLNVRADTNCLFAQRADNSADIVTYTTGILVNEGYRWPDCNKRISELFAKLTLAEQCSVISQTIAQKPSSPYSYKALSQMSSGATQTVQTIAMKQEILNARMKIMNSIPKEISQNNPNAKIINEFKDSLTQEQQALKTYIANLGKAVVKIGGIPVAPDTHVIVLPAEPTPSENQAAFELLQHLEQITGKSLNIISENDADKRYPMIIGKATKALKANAFDIDFKALGTEGIHIQTRGNAIAFGGNMRGVLYAVYEFLEDYLDCRWFTYDCTRFPKEGTFDLPSIDYTYLPPLEYRDTDYHVSRPAAFSVRNKYNGVHIPFDEKYGKNIHYHGFVHTFNSLVPPSIYAETHPEYYSEINGKRVSQNAQLCLTNPEVLKIATASVRNWLQNDVNSQIFSVSQNDNRSYCQCKNCTAVAEKEGSQAGLLLQFVNAIARDIAKDYPDKIIDTLAYQYTRKPPKYTKPEPNVAIRLCSIECCFTHTLETCSFNKTFVDDIIGWNKICNRLHIWDYVINYAHTIMPFPNLEVIKPNIQFFIKHGVTGIYEEANYFSRGAELDSLRSYLMAKCLWNPEKANTETIIREFTDAYYGTAAQDIRDYLSLIHRKVCDNHSIHVTIYRPPQYYLNDMTMINDALGIFKQALDKVKGNETLTHRVKLALLPVIYTKFALDKSLFKRTPSSLNATSTSDEELYTIFAETVKRESITHFREGNGDIQQWLDANKSGTQKIDIKTLKNGLLKLEFIPSIGGRLWSATELKSGRELLKVEGNDVAGFDPFNSGFEFYSNSSYRGPGWSTPFTVTKQTDNEIGMTATLPDKRIMTMAYTLHPTKAQFTVKATITSPVATKDMCFRIHPMFAVSTTEKTTVSFPLQNGTTRVLDCYDPVRPQAEHDEWLEGKAMPNGQWTINDAQTGIKINSTFNTAEVDKCYANWNGKDARVNLEIFTKPMPREANTPATLTCTYDIVIP